MRKDIGSKIKAVRERHRLKQFEVAKAYGVNSSYISNLERGVTRVSDEVFQKFEVAFETFNLNLKKEIKKLSK